MIDLNYLTDLSQRYPNATNSLQPRSYSLRGIDFQPWPDVSIMGVINLSADSWYRESVVTNVEAAVRRGQRLAIEGAQLIDIGAESTLLKAALVDAKTQCTNLVPIVQELNALGVLVSVETYYPEVTRACLQAGAAVINLTVGENTAAFYQMVAEYDAGVVICYIQNAENVRKVADFQMNLDHTQILYEYFAREIELASSKGVEHIWIDPGLGFYYRNLSDSKQRVRYQIETFLNTFRLRSLGFPVCHALPHAFEYFEEEVRCSEPFFAVMALLGQTDLLRTHEVAKVRAVIKTMQVMP